MPAEVVACVLGVIALVLAGVMEAVGVMGIAGAVRFAGCRRCARWTMGSVTGEPVCHKCRHREHIGDHGRIRFHIPRLHLGH